MRWFTLLAFNFAGWFALGFKSVYIDHHQGPSAIDISIGLPLSLSRCWPRSSTFTLLARSSGSASS